MHRFTILTALVLLCTTAAAAPVDLNNARLAGTHYLQQNGLIKSSDTLTFYKSYGFQSLENEETTCFYVFNIGSEGFVLVSADDRCAPIIGRSMNGAFDTEKLPDNMRGWLNTWEQEIEDGIRANAPENEQNKKLWAELLRTPASIPPTPKSESYLVTSTWEQGSGYNNYCPTYQGSHVVVGCVATAMAQIIRYWGYPTRGFGHKSYTHEYYGPQSVDFDTTDFDYSLMPDHLNRRSSNAEREMVSRLCYYCGVVVSMNYQNPNHTDGSGAQTEKVADGIMHFGYTESVHSVRTDINDDARWVSIIKEEIDSERPIEYSGFGNSGGHAFVLDGYNNNNEYHFNWGWGGYGDGFYTLTTMQGFTSTHEMITNIKPSGWDGHLTHFLVSPNGNGDGTSWENANSDITSAIRLNKLVTRDIWLKEGLYYGDTSAEYAYKFTTPCSIYGGFAGTETEIGQCNAKAHPTIFDGQGRHGVLNVSVSNSSSRQFKMSNIIIQNGYSNTGSSLSINGNVLASQMVVRNCQSDSGRTISLSNSVLRSTRIYGNQAPIICNIDDATLRQSLIYNNDGNVLRINRGCHVLNCDIVSNKGVGTILAGNKLLFANNIVWNNDSCLRIEQEIEDSCLNYCGVESDTVLTDSTLVLLSSENDSPTGPRFIAPSTTRGILGLTEDLDWHLAMGSPCIDAGMKITESTRDGDLDMSIRCRNGVVDLGCYESNYPVGIQSAEQPRLSVSPNPATDQLRIEGCANSEACLYDISGRLVLRQLCQGSATLNISSLPQGVYFLKSGTHTAKVVKK